MQTSIAIHPVPQQSGQVPAAAVQPRAERLLRLHDVRLMTGLGKSSIYAGIQAGRFPRPVNLTPHAVAWRESEIAFWIAQRPTAAALASASPLPVPAPTAATSKRPQPALRNDALAAGKPLPAAARASSQLTTNKPAMRRMVKTAPKPSTATTSRKAPSTSTVQPKAAASATRRTSGACA